MARPSPLSLIAALTGLAFGTSLAPRASAQGDAGELYQSLLKSTVWVVIPKNTQRDGAKVTVEYSSGTGSVVDVNRRLILTNYHVVRGHKEPVVYFPAFKNRTEVITERTAYLRGSGGLLGKVVHEDRARDLAVVQLTVPLPKGVRELKLAKDRLKPGQSFHLIGNAGATEALFGYNTGVVRQVDRLHFRATNREGGEPVEINAVCVVNNASVNSGDSGGPVVNGKGELVAVVQGRKPDENVVSIFIDASEVLPVLNKARGVAPAPPVAAAPKESSDANPDKPDGKANTTAEDSAGKQEQEASVRLSVAKAFAGSGDVKKAKEKYEEVVKLYPGTKAAAEARKRLEDLEKK
jgi:S1-C subfamily serine protease